MVTSAETTLVGKRVVVTGAGQGVGQGLAKVFAESGAEVLVNDLRHDRASAVADDIVAAGGQASALVFDVTDFEAVNEALTGTGAVDVLVNNAGNAGAFPFTVGHTFADTTPADWEPFFAVNLFGVMHCTRAVMGGMAARGWGRIITMISDAGRTGDQNCAAYAAAKAGAAGFSRSVAIEGGRHGVTANCIALGTMHTPLADGLWAEPESEMAQKVLRDYVIRRPGTPDDVSHLALLLAGQHGEWITGQTIPVNGGYSFAL
ncbi:SDR family NAD(P)-dependent oxidoreductase [Gordonia sp. LSe1-13]|uniref:3-oxoacyl-[acyl-carrier-protein] reductase MabA n=1 Tax=Gordonia sesuvii TaxID=3116777 RepID=A0ABU7M947_9ACTN|nr:SDR family NAD(P)-dependent oxidoreductase [Gordonia sp. LSe1-13]